MRGMFASIEDVIERVRGFARFKALSVRTLAQMADLSEKTLSGMYNSRWSPNARTLRKLERIIPPGFDPTMVRAAERTERRARDKRNSGQHARPE